MMVHFVALSLGQRVHDLLVGLIFVELIISPEEKMLSDEKMMSVLLMLNDSEPSKALMVLMESKKYKQGLDKSKRACQLPPHVSALDVSDLDDTSCPHPHSQPHHFEVGGQVPCTAASAVDGFDEEHPPIVNHPTRTDQACISDKAICAPDVTTNHQEPSRLQHQQNPLQHNE